MNIECVNPILSVTDMATSLAFYRDILGFSVAPWGDDEFTSIDCAGGSMYLSGGDQGNAGTWTGFYPPGFYQIVKDPEE